ncbi:hypothetical protein K493DRAFT_308475 [Basidiobolus meristosporus CBS 931.73]|uniref:Transmembrane protein 198 n=1 Tax=Basidiobolus meristosporus CBS 931.73 TaxID=1314790 RepID=A0A1Y1X1X1_9FUNG|nr:hypothetical protein K493DRAFT_308475 [Basidiobolus meristosporus CBS 931.73]|eukprot:ORX79800.1 hypothetical protein K493DRAFT_308475 [Basidiobolus meristosporus CBS 931.73]
MRATSSFSLSKSLAAAFIAFLCIPQVLAQGVLTNREGFTDTQKLIAAIVCIAVGFLFCFFGRYLVKVTIFVAGFFFFAGLSLFLAEKIQPTAEGDSGRAWLHLGISCAIGIIGGLLLLCLWKLGLVLIGGLGGFALAMFILSLKSGMLISSGTPRIIFIVAMVLVGMIIILFFEKHVVIICTAITGAYVFVIGIDHFVKTGFTDQLNLFWGGDSTVFYQTNAKVYAMLGSAAVLALIGILIQYRTTRSK